MDNSINSKLNVHQTRVAKDRVVNSVPKAYVGVQSPANKVSFKGLPKLNNMGWLEKGKKHFWLAFKNLSNEMNDVTEVTNAVIAAIGTGIIAPVIIMCSPGKGDKEDQDKKFFQAIRQPLSAFLALGFQLPATYLVNKGINNLAYKNDAKWVHKFFDDETLGSLIQDKKYIRKNISKDEIDAIETEFNAENSPLRQKLEEKIRKNDKEVGLDISAEKLEKKVNKKKKDFLLDEIVDRKFNAQIDAKCQELSGKNLAIAPKDTVTEGVKLLVEEYHPDELKALETQAKLSPLDRIARAMGFETKKLKALKDAQDAFKVEKGIEILQAKDPDIFEKAEQRLRTFVEAKNVKAQKIFSNKKFWLSLVVNLGMVTASCYALNWSHPRLGKLIDDVKAKLALKKNAKNNTDSQNNTKPENKTGEVKNNVVGSVTPNATSSTNMIDKAVNAVAPQEKKVEVK